MGGGYWSYDTYDRTQRSNRASGKSAFDYDAQMHSQPRDQQKIHDSLNPKGVKVRESRDSSDHPTSLAIALFFDETGSMGSIPRDLQKNLKTLFSLLLRKGYVEHPQILNGAIGDARNNEVAPLQAGQFESDNRIDDNLTHIFLEGNGGGNMHESYDLALYFMARHTVIDCWEKRRDKGVLFLIGDELPYERISRQDVKRYIGDDLDEDISLEQILAELLEKWEVFFLMAPADNYGAYKQIYKRWKDLLGERAIELTDVEGVSEKIALTIGLTKGTIDLDQGVADLQQIGSSSKVIKSVVTSLTPLSKSTSALAKGSGRLPGLTDQTLGGSGTRRI